MIQGLRCVWPVNMSSENTGCKLTRALLARMAAEKKSPLNGLFLFSGVLTKICSMSLKESENELIINFAAVGVRVVFFGI